jgi:transcriptional regulator GlxA family with amidase domain
MLDPACLIPDHPEDRMLLSSTPFAGADFANILTPTQRPQIALLLQGVITELGQRAPGYRTAVRGYILTIMAHLHRIATQNHAPTAAASPLNQMHLAPALNYLTEHYHEPLRLDQLAALCAMSEGHFRRCFHRATGLSPHHYLTRLRLTMASSLLKHTDTPILTIAMQVGYSAVSSFNRQFLALFGVPPSTWRAGER